MAPADGGGQVQQVCEADMRLVLTVAGGAAGLTALRHGAQQELWGWQCMQGVCSRGGGSSSG